MPANASCSDLTEPTKYISDELWRLFKFVELTEVMRRRRGPLFIDVLNKNHIGEIYDNSEIMVKSRLRNNKGIDYLKQDLHVFAENTPILIRNDNMLNELNNMLIEIHSIVTIPIQCWSTQMFDIKTRI